MRILYDNDKKQNKLLQGRSFFGDDSHEFYDSFKFLSVGLD